MVKKKSFLDLKVPIFYNKNNGQMSISLPKKQMKKFIGEDDEGKTNVPKNISMRLFNWGKKKGDKK